MSGANTGNADLTGFAALLGDSFSAKIDLLEKILQQHHYPSLGRYKERLLAKVISEYIPQNYSVATGFVLFVHKATKERAAKPGFDELNMGSHAISKQCDIIVYDASTIPVVFRDDDFVVVRPESVRAVIEVKGTVNNKEVDNILGNFFDFGEKWLKCQSFYREHHQPLTPRPSLYAMCWSVGKDTKGRPLTSGTKIRERVAKFYADRLPLSRAKGFPRLDKLLVYNECEISATAWFNDDEISVGYSTTAGKFLRQNEKGVATRSGDSTIASLLASLHYSVREEFNRFYSYVDETRHTHTMPYRHEGYTSWLADERFIRDVNTDLIVERK